MADASGQPPHPVAIPPDLEARFTAYEFYAALRRIECLNPQLPRLGKSARSAQDAVRLGQVPSLAFAPAMFIEADWRDGRFHLGGLFFGLFGPNGPLPLHLTEYAHDRRHNAGDDTLAAFADLFHHRMLCLFYRAWADAQPTVQADRPDGDRFRHYLGALLGIGQDSLQGRDAMPDEARLFHVGRLASGTRNAEGLRAILEDFFGEQVAVREFEPEWLTLQEEDRLRLGRSPSANALGVSSILGERVWSALSRFRIVLGRMSFQAFERFLPGTQALTQLRAIVRTYVGLDLEWDLQFIIDRAEVNGMRLGKGGRLGYSSWLASLPRARDVEDVVLKAQNRNAV
jgi:type VI secretion system protein ImpH